MNTREKASKALRAAVGLALIAQSFGCGTIMHPERKGQRDGRIDAGVAILDGIGLLFFIIPGVIAFAVDFSNGTIYLPGGGKGLLGRNEPELIRFAPGPRAKERVERAVRDRTGLAVRLDGSDVRVSAVESVDKIPALLAEHETSEGLTYARAP